MRDTIAFTLFIWLHHWDIIIINFVSERTNKTHHHHVFYLFFQKQN